MNLLLTSPSGYAQRLINAFNQYTGDFAFNCFSFPMIETDVCIDTTEFTTFMYHLQQYDFIAFSSRKAIEAFALGLKRFQIELPSRLKLCAIGKDNELLQQALGIKPAFISAEPSPMGIVHHLERWDVSEKHVAVLAPEVIGMREPSIVPDFINSLKGIGMIPQRITAYQTKAVSSKTLERVSNQIIDHQYDAVIFTSGTEINVFLQMIPSGWTLDEFIKGLTIICFGPYTAECAREQGVKVDFVSKSFGAFEGLVEQLDSYYTSQLAE